MPITAAELAQSPLVAENKQERIAIIGAGLAGVSAALTLALKQSAKHCHITIFEAGPIPGGRARKVIHRAQNDIVLDNGLHILIGAYSETLRLIKAIGAREEDLLQRLPLQLEIAGALSMRAPPMFRNTIGLGVALITAKGINWSEKFAMVRMMVAIRLGHFKTNGTVSEALKHHNQPARLCQLVWEPLCVATLNTIAADASATVFARVLKDALLGANGGSDLLLPKADLSALLPQPACDWLESHGHSVRLSTRVNRLVSHSQQGFTVNDESTFFDKIIIATAPRETADLLTASQFLVADKTDGTALSQLSPLLQTLKSFTYRSIHSVYLQYEKTPTLPCPMLGFSNPPNTYSQWVFDRNTLANQPGLLGVVISDSQAAKALGHDELANAVHEELCQALGPQNLPNKPLWSKVIQEKFATFACVPNLARPATQTPIPGLFLAGDYVDGPYPATIEGAVRSGIQAANVANITVETT